MYHEFFTRQGVLLLPIFAMLLFAATFAGVVIAAIHRGRSGQDQELARLPLQSDDRETET